MKQTSELDSVAQNLELADGMQNHYDYHVKSTNKKKWRTQKNRWIMLAEKWKL